MSHSWPWFIVAFLLLIAVFSRVRPGSKKKMVFDTAKLRIPFIRMFVQNAEVARLARTLGLLLHNGISVYESLDLARETVGNDVLRDQLGAASREIVTQGNTLAGSLQDITFFPNFALNMIAVGEQGGRLEESLGEIAEVYERDVRRRIKLLSSLLEPILILVVGAVVAFIVMAMLLPIFDIGIIAR